MIAEQEKLSGAILYWKEERTEQMNKVWLIGKKNGHQNWNVLEHQDVCSTLLDFPSPVSSAYI